MNNREKIHRVLDDRRVVHVHRTYPAMRQLNHGVHDDYRLGHRVTEMNMPILDYNDYELCI